MNTGDAPVRLLAAFPATSIVIAMLERNPAPNTEDDPPTTARYDLRSGVVERLG